MIKRNIKGRGFSIVNAKTKCLIALIFLGIVDAVIPIPILGLILIYVLIQKPAWFKDLVQEIYGTT